MHIHLFYDAGAPEFHVQQVEEKLVHYMDCMSLGMPREINKTVKDVFNGITAYSGFMVQGEGVEAFENVTDRISDFITLWFLFKRFFQLF